MELRECEAMACREILKHGLHDWTFGWAKTKRRLGVCKYRTKRIEIAEYHARNNSPESVLDTLLHEIAHALAGAAARHGPVWKAMAVRIGATPRACSDNRETALMPGDWQATCPTCKKTYHLYRCPKVLTAHRCRCRAKSPLLFEYKGDPANAPVVPMTLQECANWEAVCAGCKTVHLRLRKPKAGIWHCRCTHRCKLTWQVRSR